MTSNSTELLFICNLPNTAFSEYAFTFFFSCIRLKNNYGTLFRITNRVHIERKRFQASQRRIVRRLVFSTE